MRQKNLFLLLSLLIVVAMIPFISAGFWDFLTGQATQPTNVSITVTTIQVDWVSPISAQSVTEGSTTDVVFYFSASIPGGAVADINDSSARANFTRSGESTRQNLSCAWLSDLDADTANYSCLIQMWYWDEAGDWNITAAIEDNNQNGGQNDTTWFTYQETTAFAISPSALTFPAGLKPGDTNQTPNNDPTLMNNTANKEIATGHIELRALNLHGETSSTYFIGSGNFTADIETGASAECDGAALSNATYVNVTGALLPRGNNTNGDGQEQLYYCLTSVNADLIGQIYSTDQLGSWTIQIT